MFTPPINPTGGSGNSLKDILIALALSSKERSAGDLLNQRRTNRNNRELGGILANQVGEQSPFSMPGQANQPVQVAQAGPTPQINTGVPQQPDISPLQAQQRRLYSQGRIEQGDAIGQRISAAQSQRLAQIEKVTTESIQIADTLLNASPEDREVILDYYRDNPRPGFPPNALEKYRGAPDAVLQAERQRALTIKDRVDQFNKTRDFDLRAEDTRADNTRADRTLDNTVRNTDSLIEDRGIDNTLARDTLNQTINRDNQTSADRAAALQAKSAGGPGGKPFPDASAKAAGFANRAIASGNSIDGFVEQGFNAANPKGLELFRGETRRKYESAQREWINAILRRESGAVIGPEEFKNYNKLYFPQLGDNKAVRDFKREARKRAEQGMVAESQGAYDAFFNKDQNVDDNLPPLPPGYELD